jgi:hypothetical protein
MLLLLLMMVMMMKMMTMATFSTHCPLLLCPPRESHITLCDLLFLLRRSMELPTEQP